MSILSFLCVSLNNSTNKSTDKSLNELIYEFNLHNFIQLLNIEIQSEVIKFAKQRIINQKKVVNVITFINIHVKMWYNIKHTFFLSQSDNKTYIWLYQSYCSSKIVNSKLFLQCIESFKMIKCVKNLVYKLKLLTN